jgi:hypothetical protein
LVQHLLESVCVSYAGVSTAALVAVRLQDLGAVEGKLQQNKAATAMLCVL